MSTSMCARIPALSGHGNLFAMGSMLVMRLGDIISQLQESRRPMSLLIKICSHGQQGAGGSLTDNPEVPGELLTDWPSLKADFLSYSIDQSLDYLFGEKGASVIRFRWFDCGPCIRPSK